MERMILLDRGHFKNHFECGVEESKEATSLLRGFQAILVKVQG